MTTCAIVSFRLGLTDGVSIVADSWAEALDRLGFDVVTVAGEGPVDRTGRRPGDRRHGSTAAAGRRESSDARCATPTSSWSRTCARSR